MTDITMTPPKRSPFLQYMRNLVRPRRDPATPNEGAAEDSRFRRAFVMEMLDRCPDAFASEMDIEHLAHLYRSRF